MNHWGVDSFVTRSARAVAGSLTTFKGSLAADCDICLAASLDASPAQCIERQLRTVCLQELWEPRARGTDVQTHVEAVERSARVKACCREAFGDTYATRVLSCCFEDDGLGSLAPQQS